METKKKIIENFQIQRDSSRANISLMDKILRNINRPELKLDDEATIRFEEVKGRCNFARYHCADLSYEMRLLEKSKTCDVSLEMSVSKNEPKSHFLSIPIFHNLNSELGRNIFENSNLMGTSLRDADSFPFCERTDFLKDSLIATFYNTFAMTEIKMERIIFNPLDLENLLIVDSQGLIRFLSSDLDLNNSWYLNLDDNTFKWRPVPINGLPNKEIFVIGENLPYDPILHDKLKSNIKTILSLNRNKADYLN